MEPTGAQGEKVMKMTKASLVSVRPSMCSSSDISVS